MERLVFIGGWAAGGKPAVYWISGFFFPQVGGRAAERLLCVRVAVAGPRGPGVPPRQPEPRCSHVGRPKTGPSVDRHRPTQHRHPLKLPPSHTPLSRTLPRPHLTPIPQAFLTGTLQNYARRHGYPIDTVAFEHKVLDFGPPGGEWEAPEDGCYVRGMFLEGARWDPELHALGGAREQAVQMSWARNEQCRHLRCSRWRVRLECLPTNACWRRPQLQAPPPAHLPGPCAEPLPRAPASQTPTPPKPPAESRPKELYTPMPPLWLRPRQNRPPDLPDAGQSRSYECPLYKTLTRAGTLSTTGHSTNFVMSVELDGGGRPPAHWVARGVALFAALPF